MTEKIQFPKSSALYYLEFRSMDKVQKQSYFERYAPSPEPFRFYLVECGVISWYAIHELEIIFEDIITDFLNSFISNQNYFRFYKLICWLYIYICMTLRGLSNDKSSLTFFYVGWLSHLRLLGSLSVASYDSQGLIWLHKLIKAKMHLSECSGCRGQNSKRQPLEQGSEA
jgi:hypothetical protein